MQITTKTAADRLGITSQRVIQLIKSNRLAAVKHGRDYVIDDRSLAAVMVRQTGRPRKNKLPMK